MRLGPVHCHLYAFRARVSSSANSMRPKQLGPGVRRPCLGRDLAVSQRCLAIGLIYGRLVNCQY